MRILNIRFCNLNSLSGEWEIDLTDPAYAAEGLFAITGPTGAGKSTLLDAICLALYGRTPRQSNVSKNQNEVMSRQTGECFAEVEFETPQGRWRVHWSQHRSRKKAEGALQQPKQEIIDAASGRVLHTKIRAVEETVERLTGMDFERFTRSMLLAQGGFAAFLQADPDTRAPILEQITGTSIYSDISIAVHQKRGEQRQQLEQLRAAQSGLQLLEAEAEAELTRQLEQVSGAVQTQQQAVEQQQQLLEWRNRLEQARQQQEALSRRQAELAVAQAKFAPRQQQLERALQTRSLQPDYERLQQRRQDLHQSEQRLAQWQGALPQLEQESRTSAARLQQARQQLQQAESCLSAQQPLIAQLREQDGVVRDQWRKVKQLHQALPAQLLSSPAPDPSRLEAEIATTEQALQEALVAGDRQQLAAQQEQLHGRGKWLAELKQQVAQLAKLAAARSTLQQERDELEQQQRQRQGEIDQLQPKIDGLQREQQDLLKLQQLADRIARLEQQRRQLVSGEPCPLCGATEHPWAEETPPELSAEQARLQRLEQTLAQCQSELQQRQQERAALSASAQSKAQQLQENQRDAAELQAQMAAPLSALGWQQVPSLEQIAQAHRKAQLQWKALRDQRQVLDALDEKLRQLRAERQAWQQRVEYDAARTELEQQQARRAALSPEPDTSAWERRLQQAVDQARQNLEQARSAEESARLALTEQKQKVDAEQQRRAQLAGETDALLGAFQQRLADSPFGDEAAFNAARVPDDQLQTLQQQAQSLQEQLNELNALQRENRLALAQFEREAYTQEGTEQLQAALAQLRQQLSDLLKQQGSLQQQLTRNAALKQQFGEQQRQIEAQQRELERWEQLHALIGSADGKKFRNFAQGLTFELMVGHANRQLQKMSDRYLLVRDEARPLELNVIDNYQAGEIRSTKNLSGGESFLVSLALALGLSGMASRNVRVDSLFLDEGFGTLDEEALETALDTLAGLQQEGKLIGVISHVQALKERISTRIEVQPLSGGRSRISGPGCRQLHA